jgi:hypothetical protein
MLCVNNYGQDYIDDCRSRVAAQVAAYQTLVATARHQGASDGPQLETAIAAFEPQFFNNMVLTLDSYFTHRARALEKKDGNPLNEVRMLCNALTNNHGVMCADKTIKYDPAKSVLKYQVGDQIGVTEAEFVRLSAAFFAEIESKFL